MGRRKSYERGDLIEKAMTLFWQHGFEATSTAALTERLGVNKFGLYAEFGSKQGLFDAVLQHYDDIVVSGHFGRLETPDAGLDDIAAVVDFFATAEESDDIRLGCLMCNTATERAAIDPMSAERVEGFVARLTHAHRNALENAARNGQLRDGTDVPAQAALLVTQLLGMFVLRRSQSDPTVWRLAGLQARQQVEALRADPG